MTSVLTVTGWTLIHFTWQGALIAAVVAIALRLADAGSARLRYAIACAGLGAMLAAPLVTARLLSAADAPVVESTPLSAADPSAGRPATAVDGPAPASAPIPMASAASRIDPQRLLSGLAVAWLCGVAILLARLGGGWWYVRKLHRSASATPASAWQASCDRIAARLRLFRAAHVVESALVDVPTVIGWLRPVIVLPIAAVAALTPAQVEAILAHELAHVRRHDYAVNLLQTIAETLLFYHPAVWWLSNRIRVEREHCCDDVAITLCGDRIGYARALAELETWRVTAAPMALAATGGSLVDRIGRILRVPRDDGRSPRWAATLVLTLLFSAGAGSIARLPRLGANAGAETMTAASAAAQRPAPVAVPEAAQAPPPQPGLSAPPAMPAASEPRDQIFDVPPAPPVPSEPPAPPAPPAPPSSAAPPAPPAPPAPSAPPAPPAPPAPSASAQREWHSEWSNDREHIDVRLRGDVTFSDDLTDVKSMADGSALTIREWHGVIPHTIEFKPDGRAVTRTYYVAGVKHTWDADADRILRDLLPRLVRNSAIGAEGRVKSILAAKGAAGVLAEIDLVTSDYARRVYYNTLIDQAGLDAAGVMPVLADVGRRMSSDYERAQVLQHVAARVRLNPQAADAYVKAMAGMRSDYERRRALTALFTSIGSTVGPAAFTAIDSISSAYERRQVLTGLIATGELGDDMKRGVLASARTMRSDYERRQVLMAYVAAFGVDSAVRAPFFSAVSAFTSDYERRQVLTAVAAKKALATDVQQAAFDATMGMRSDYDRAETLLAFLNGGAVDSGSRKAFVDAADRIRSRYDQNRVLAALVKSERR